MDEKNLEQLLNILTQQHDVNKQIEKILKSLTLGGTSPDLDDLKKLIKQHHKSSEEFEKNIKDVEG
jgi:ferritin-like metal-binding protein YciE